MSDWWSLKIISGPNTGQLFSLKKEGSVVGRVEGDIVIAKDGEISSLHAQITYDARRRELALTDLRSRNGTWVNGNRITSCILNPGDQIRIGTTILVLEAPVYKSEATIKIPVAPEKTITSHDHQKAKNENEQSHVPSSQKAPARPPKPVYQPREYARFSFMDAINNILTLVTKPQSFFESYNKAKEPKTFRDLRNSLILFIAATLVSSAGVLLFAKAHDPATAAALGKIFEKIGTMGSALVFVPLLPLVVLFSLLGVFLKTYSLGWVFRFLGGEYEFKRLLEFFIYTSTATMTVGLLIHVPRFGPYVVLLFALYTCYLIGVAAQSLFSIERTRAYALAAVLGVLSIAANLSKTMREQYTTSDRVPAQSQSK